MVTEEKRFFGFSPYMNKIITTIVLSAICAKSLGVLWSIVKNPKAAQIFFVRFSEGFTAMKSPPVNSLESPLFWKVSFLQRRVPRTVPPVNHKTIENRKEAPSFRQLFLHSYCHYRHRLVVVLWRVLYFLCIHTVFDGKMVRHRFFCPFLWKRFFVVSFSSQPGLIPSSFPLAPPAHTYQKCRLRWRMCCRSWREKQVNNANASASANLLVHKSSRKDCAARCRRKDRIG